MNRLLSDNKEKRLAWIHITLLVFLVSLHQLLPMQGGMIFGSEGDWYSQHVAIAETLRQAMLESGKLVPQFISLGGGSSIYDFSYYGVLRPDILIACLLPNVEMKYIISVYALLGIYASGILCYFWLKKNRISPWFSFIVSVLLISSTCFYQSHHQIIFVNYLPFLILAFWGIQIVIERGKSGLLIIALFLIDLHSFYYVPACLCAAGIYSISLFLQCGKRWNFIVRKSVKLLAAAMTATGMAMVLLLPTGLNILSTSKDSGRFGTEALKWIDPGMGGLFYSPYSCGMTLLALYCLLLALCHKGKRFLAGILLICMMCPAVSLVLNGFLYAREKILIPFMPLLVLLCADSLYKLWKKEYRHQPVLLILCLLPLCFSKWKPIILLDFLILAVWLFLQMSGIRKIKALRKATYFICLLIPIMANVALNYADYDPELLENSRFPLKINGYIRKEDQRQNWCRNLQDIEIPSDDLYRFEVNTDAFVNCNLIGEGRMQRTSMYSSITNSRYADFFYNTMKNAISYNNRVVLVAGNNPCFQYFMGSRYLLTEENDLPENYRVLKKNGTYVFAENEKVLPVCYGTTELISQKVFDELEFPNNLEALCQSTVVDSSDEASDDFTPHFVRMDSNSFFEDEGVIKNPLPDHILILQFQVKSLDGDQVIISINGIKNKLSSADAPYPNENHTFTYIMDTGKGIKELDIEASNGDYQIENLKIYMADKKYLSHDNITIPEVSTPASRGEDVFFGEIRMEQNGYFVTSYPYRDGYKVYVDGKKENGEVVNTAFLGFPIAKGEHSITIRFEAPGYRIGKYISIFSFCFYFGILLKEYSKKYRRSESNG